MINSGCVELCNSSYTKGTYTRIRGVDGMEKVIP